MTAAEFTLTTNWPTEELEHDLTVLVHDTREAMLLHLEEHEPSEDWRNPGEGPTAVFAGAGGFHTKSAPRNLGTIHYHREDLRLGTLMHELAHASMHIYSVDVVSTYSRALVHMTADNEEFAYLLENLVEQLADHLVEGGFYK